MEKPEYIKEVESVLDTIVMIKSYCRDSKKVLMGRTPIDYGGIIHLSRIENDFLGEFKYMEKIK